MALLPELLCQKISARDLSLRTFSIDIIHLKGEKSCDVKNLRSLSLSFSLIQMKAIFTAPSLMFALCANHSNYVAL